MKDEVKFRIGGIEYYLKIGYVDLRRKYFTLTKGPTESFCITFSGTYDLQTEPVHYMYTTEYIYVDGNYIEEKKLPSNDKAAIAKALSILNSSYS